MELVTPAEQQLHAGDHQEAAEDVIDPVEALEEGRAGQDEGGPHHEGVEDPPEADAVLIGGRDRKEEKSTMNTKRLSTESAFSMRYPVNSRPRCAPNP